MSTNKSKAKKFFSIFMFVIAFSLMITGCSIVGTLKTNNVTIIQNTYSAETIEKLTTSIETAVAKVENSVVEIYATNNSGTSCGSGVIINTSNMDNIASNLNEYYVITNFHVIEDASDFYIKITNSNKTYKTLLLGGDYKSDIAVLLIKTTDSLSSSTFGDSSLLKKGQTCFAIGNPLGQLGGTVSVGNISFLNRQIYVEGNLMTLIQTTAAINSGNSGGGLFNEVGDLIGVVNAKSSGTGIEGIGFAIPSNYALNSFSSIISTCVIADNTVVNYGYVEGNHNLGLTVTESSGYLVVKDVMNNSDCANTVGNVSSSLSGSFTSTVTGIVAGDRIISVNGSVIYTISDYLSITSNIKVGDTLKIVVLRQTSVSLWTSEVKNSYITFNITLTQFCYVPPTN